MMRILWLVLAALFVTGCGYDCFGPPAAPPGVDELANVPIGRLRDFYYDEAVEIVEPIVVAGRVITSDRAGNFYRSFFIDDGTGAVEIRAGMYDLHSLYPPGRRVVVRLQGLVLGRYNGVMQLGMPSDAWSGYETEYFASYEQLDRYVLRDTSVKSVEPVDRRPADFDERLCGRLVRIGPVVCHPDDRGTWADVVYSRSGYVRFLDRDGTCTTVVTSAYADFAGRQVPVDSVWLTGILSYGKPAAGSECYMLKIRNIDDVVYGAVLDTDAVTAVGMR